jgi:hypothetical protein
MRALETEVVDAVFAAIESLLLEPPAFARMSPPESSRPALFLGVPDPADHQVVVGRHRSDPRTPRLDTTLRTGRVEWIAAGVFDQLCAEAVAAFDRIIWLYLSEFAIDGSLHKAPYGGEGTGPNPTDRAKHGWSWSIE